MSEHPQARRASQAWWLAVILGAAAAVASFFVGGGGTIQGGLLAAVLNPLGWLGLWAYAYRVGDPYAKCPHCGKWIDLDRWSHIPALGLCKCDCGHTFVKPPA